MQGQLSAFEIPSDSATSGKKALELFEKRLQALALDNTQPPYKLILLDYNMPGMSGPQTAHNMHRLLT